MPIDEPNNEPSNDQTIAYELDRLRGEMLELLAEMKEVIGDADNQQAAKRANTYWIPHVTMALTKDHQWLGGSMVDCDDTIEELSEPLED